MSAIVFAAYMLLQNGNWLAFGTMSCATWNSNRSTAEVEGRAFILGFWSGRNSALGLSVGETAGTDGIVEEVRLLCRAEPSLPLASATLRTYDRLRLAAR